MVWNFDIHSVPTDLYRKSESTLQIILEVFCVLMLAINNLLEMKGIVPTDMRTKKHFKEKLRIDFVCIFSADLLDAIRRFQILDYLLDPWNTIDWLHMALMWVSLSLWVYQYQKSSSFTMMPRYEILKNTGARARFFKTEAEQEYNFLQFSSNLKDLSHNFEQYISISSLCGRQFCAFIIIQISNQLCQTF